MKRPDQYLVESGFVAAVFVLGITGFWVVYFGPRANPDAYHHLHVLTVFAWLLLLMIQLRLMARNDFKNHRRVGLFVLVMAPLLVATTALLSVHSAHKGLVSGRGDVMIVQNVMVTLELALLIVLAFVLRRRRKLHGALLLSTAVLFMGIALFFTLIGLVPGFRIEGPETFGRFQSSAMTAQFIVLAVGALFLLKDWRNGWPYLLAAVFLILNEVIRGILANNALLGPLTELVGSLSQSLTFLGSFAVLAVLLVATGLLDARQARP